MFLEGFTLPQTPFPGVWLAPPEAYGLPIRGFGLLQNHVKTNRKTHFLNRRRGTQIYGALLFATKRASGRFPGFQMPQYGPKVTQNGFYGSKVAQSWL